MQQGQHPDAIDTRLVLRLYGWLLAAIGLAFVDGFPFFLVAARPDYDLPGVPWGRVGLIRIAGAAVAAFGFTAIGLSRIENPVSRRQGLLWFAIGHMVFGAIFILTGGAIFGGFIPFMGLWTPLIIGSALLYIALTCAQAPRFHRHFQGLFDSPVTPVLIERARPGAMDTLRSQYEEQIRQAARLEERARLARDLHDAVKQQLFAIQTSAATAQARFDSDGPGAQAALDQIRASARAAMTEMEAMIAQLQASPMENAGLVSALREQCNALALRSGTEVTFDTGALPSNDALPPGTQQALFRAAQEALANVARHARARHVTVRLGLVGRTFRLTVRDDGAGFEPTGTPDGMGMHNMRARVCEVAGAFLLQSTPGRGTTVGFSVPCDLSTPADFGTRALLWAAICALMIVSFVFGDDWERPWNAMLALIAGITVARYLVAWHRVRLRREVVA